MVLEVGAGEGVLSARLAPLVAHLHAVEIDRERLEPALAEVAALPNVTLHWGDAVKLDFRAFDPAPNAMVANLPYSVATPVILQDDRRAAQPADLDRDGPAGDRRAPSRPPRQPHLRGAERGRPARLRGRADPQGRPRRLQAAARGSSPRSCGCDAPARAPTRRPATSSAPPSPTAAKRWRGRWRSPACAASRSRAPPPAPAWRSSGCARTPVQRAWRRPSSPLPCTGDPTPRGAGPAAMLVHAPAKLNLGLYLGRPRPDGLHELCSLFEPLALADLLRIEEAERDEVDLSRGRGREPRRPGAGEAARARLGRPTVADRDREAHPGRRRPRRRLRRRRRRPPPRRGERLRGRGRHAFALRVH